MNEQDEPQMPPRLAQALKRAAETDVPFVPRTVDDAVLRAAEEKFGVKKKPATNWGRLTVALVGVTAVVVIGVILVHQTPGPVAKGPATASEDLNADNRIDILDAFVLARRIEGEGKASRNRTAGENGPFLDLNGDGVCDDRDVAILAGHAVRLGEGGRS